MPASVRPARRFLWLRLLRGSLVFGALYDLVFALVMVAAPSWPARTLHLPLPGAAFYLWILATLLAMLAACYLLAAWDPRRYAGVIVVAIVGRLCGAAAFALAALADPNLSGLWPLAAADGLFGLVHLAGARPLFR